MIVSRPGVSDKDKEGSRLLLRHSVLDAMRDLLLERDWSDITMADVAAGASVSRQTLYKEFRSRQGLAQGYALRLADRFVDAMGDAVNAHVGDAGAALAAGFGAYFLGSDVDPLVQSLRRGEAKPDLLRIITTDSAPLIEHASTRVAEILERSWIRAAPTDAGILSRAIVRIGLSYVSMPPEPGSNVAEDLGRLLAPFVDATVEVADRA